MEAPAGLVQIEYKLAEENRTAAGNRVKVESVKLTNVPAFLHSSDLIAECPELGVERRVFVVAKRVMALGATSSQFEFALPCATGKAGNRC